MSRYRLWIQSILSLLLSLGILAGCAGGHMMGASNPPADLDVATTLLSEQGLFRISYAPEETPLEINQTLRWRLTVMTAADQPVTGATIAISGDMPEHGHGLPTAPAVTAELGNGDYLLEGLRFQMPGWWTVTVAVTAGSQQDRATFNLVLP